MQLTLRIHFFSSALGGPSVPDNDPESPFQAGLILEGIEDPVGIEFVDIQEIDETTRRVVSETLNPDVETSLIDKGAEFFLTKGGKMLGKGTVEEAGP